MSEPQMDGLGPSYEAYRDQFTQPDEVPAECTCDQPDGPGVCAACRCCVTCYESMPEWATCWVCAERAERAMRAVRVAS